MTELWPPQVSEGLSGLRRPVRPQDKATVKGLIDSIETAAKARTASYTRSSSTPSMPCPLSPIAENPKLVLQLPCLPPPASSVATRSRCRDAKTDEDSSLSCVLSAYLIL